ncbi:hypothetical protein SAMN05216338_1014138 [Bradyrhizobium sp. Rc2d]|uniref:hypothetical protein n=1 Tax=Bradyrhizobium sp. Rc2d TaxID=1855321 RepID=UPI0008838CC1|nr:hypothetical protein [Bradyrhizobium sp. Rc2d]SDH88914.1 hypothetical protein SAMN05216338_1014138 [Bradyrhizobium sp. Rc2d]
MLTVALTAARNTAKHDKMVMEAHYAGPIRHSGYVVAQTRLSHFFFDFKRQCAGGLTLASATLVAMSGILAMCLQLDKHRVACFSACVNVPPILVAPLLT